MGIFRKKPETVEMTRTEFKAIKDKIATENYEQGYQDLADKIRDLIALANFPAIAEEVKIQFRETVSL